LILCITGSTITPYERLLRKIDSIAEHFDVPFVLQTGPYRLQSKSCETFTFVPYDRLIEYYKKAQLIISHLSGGPLIYSRKFEKPIILVPRKKALGEAVADNQIETAEALKTVHEPMRMILDEVDELEPAVRTMLGRARDGLRYCSGTREIESLHRMVREACGLAPVSEGAVCRK
jgi:UDP-N-acetylglucosamine transferase subunit ALG13